MFKSIATISKINTNIVVLSVRPDRHTLDPHSPLMHVTHTYSHINTLFYAIE